MTLTIQLPAGIRHADSASAARDVAGCRTAAMMPAGRSLAPVIASETAATVAAWWQSPGAVGRHLASLASGAPVALGDLLDDIGATYDEATTAEDRAALEELERWAHRTARQR